MTFKKENKNQKIMSCFLVFTRNSDNFISGQRMSDILFSDNLTLLFKLKTA